MTELDTHLRHFDDGWSHRFESLTAVLQDLTDEEAFWQHPAYAGESPEEGWPPPGSVAWQVAHVAHCKRHYTDICLHAESEERPEVRPWTPCRTVAELLEVLGAAHREQREAIAGLGEDRLDLDAGNGMPYREFLAMCIRHDAWHAGQMAVARRLYRTRD